MTTVPPQPVRVRPRDGEVVLSVRGLVKHFPVARGLVPERARGVVRAVDGVDLELRRGETLGIVGESGCGKSTLARLLLAIEKPTAGEVVVLGERPHHLHGRHLKAVRRHIQLVFQDPFTALNPRMTVAEIVREPLDVHRGLVPRQRRRDAVLELLELVGLNPDHAERYPHQFSGGQRQRIGIARALAVRPQILVCDEPVSALDVSVQAQVVNLLERLQDELDLSYVFIAHDLSVVQHMADRVAVMYLGKVVELGTDTEIYDHATHPYSQALLSAAPIADPILQQSRQRIILPGEPPSPLNPPSGCRFRNRCWKAQDVCATDVPELVPRDGSAHPVACHFAEEL